MRWSGSRFSVVCRNLSFSLSSRSSRAALSAALCMSVCECMYLDTPNERPSTLRVVQVGLMIRSN